MTLHPSVLIGLSVSDGVGESVAGWVRQLGYEPTVTLGGGETLAWVQEHACAASLLDAGLVAETGERVWRRVRPIVGRRLILMVREPRRDLWFEALGAGIGAVLWARHTIGASRQAEHDDDQIGDRGQST